MELNEILANRPPSKQRATLVFVIHELTVEARGEEDLAKVRGIIEAIHTIAGALLPGPHKDIYVGDTLRDFGRIYAIDENLTRVFDRVGRTRIG